MIWLIFLYCLRESNLTQSKGQSLKAQACVSGQSFSYWVPDRLERRADSRASKPVVVSAGWHMHMLHPCCLLQAVSCSPHRDTSPACMEVPWIYPRRVRETVGPSTSTLQAGSSPAADVTRGCVSVEASARVLLYTAMQQHNGYTKTPAEFSISATS